MKQRIEVGGEGIALAGVELPWDEVARAVLSGGTGGLVLTVETRSGEAVEVGEAAEGFGEAVAGLAGMSGVEIPSPLEGPVTLWEPRTSTGQGDSRA